MKLPPLSGMHATALCQNCDMRFYADELYLDRHMEVWKCDDCLDLYEEDTDVVRITGEAKFEDYDGMADEYHTALVRLEDLLAHRADMPLDENGEFDEVILQRMRKERNKLIELATKEKLEFDVISRLLCHSLRLDLIAHLNKPI